MTRPEDPARQEDPNLTYLTHGAAYGRRAKATASCSARSLDPAAIIDRILGIREL
jgi:hypothetical protein